MRNFNNTEEEIVKAHNSGLISASDFEKWKGVQGYSNMLKKSADSSEISKSTYTTEKAKVDSYFFERDLSDYKLSYKLKGVNIDPIDLFKTHDVMKSIKQEPLQNNKIEKEYAALKKMNRIADEIWKLVDKVKTKRK